VAVDIKHDQDEFADAYRPTGHTRMYKMSDAFHKLWIQYDPQNNVRVSDNTKEPDQRTRTFDAKPTKKPEKQSGIMHERKDITERHNKTVDSVQAYMHAEHLKLVKSSKSGKTLKTTKTKKMKVRK
jgi:hypothetical protein